MQRLAMTDWHTHILPAMDDGSVDAAESLAMLELSAKQGVTAVVLTPHFYPQKESPIEFFRRREESLKALESAISNRIDQVDYFLPERILGAEVYYFAQLASMPKEDLKNLCIGNTKMLMVEMPQEPWDESAFRCLEELIYSRNLTPVLAHIERYYKFINNIKRLESLIGEGLLVQMNAGDLLSITTRSKAIKWIVEDRVHLLGSDCHNLNTRKSNLDKAYKILNNKVGQFRTQDLFRSIAE